MNTAIWITTTLIMAQEKGVELRVQNGHLQVRPSSPPGEELRSLLKEYKTGITERLEADAARADPFAEFLDQCCLFYRGDGLVVPKKELEEVYRQWAAQKNKPVLPTYSLEKRLRKLGCQAVTIDSEKCLDHVCIWWPALQSFAAESIKAEERQEDPLG